MFGGRWLLFLRSSSSSFSFACVRFLFFGLHLLPRLCSDRAGKPGEKPQARTRSGSRHSRLRSAPSSKRRGGGAQRRREAPTRMPGLAVSLLLMSRSWRFLFFLVLLVRLRLQCLLRSSRSCIACLACGSRSERASRSMIARFFIGPTPTGGHVRSSWGQHRLWTGFLGPRIASGTRLPGFKATSG